MNVDDVMVVMAEFAPERDPRNDCCNSDYTIVMNDGGLVDALDPNGPWELLDVTREFNRTGIKTKLDLIRALGEYKLFAGAQWS